MNSQTDTARQKEYLPDVHDIAESSSVKSSSAMEKKVQWALPYQYQVNGTNETQIRYEKETIFSLYQYTFNFVNEELTNNRFKKK